MIFMSHYIPAAFLNTNVTISRGRIICTQQTANSTLPTQSGRQGVGDGRRWIIDVQRAGHKQNTHVCTTILVGTFHWDIHCIHLYTLYSQAPTSHQPQARHRKHIRTWALSTFGVHARKKSPTANKIQIHTKCMQMHFYLLSLAHPFLPIYRVVFFPAPSVILWRHRQMEGLYGERLIITRGEITMYLLLGYKLLLTATGGLFFLFYPFSSISRCMFCVFFPKKWSLSLRLHFT